MNSQSTNGPELRHPSSFRDPDSIVVVAGDRVLRLYSAVAKYEESLRFLNATFAKEAVATGHLLEAETIPTDQLPEGSVGGISSRRLGFVTDPREWSFTMRRDAAQLTVRLSQQALAGGYEMKDASAFNILFDGSHPVFVDHGSFREDYSGHWPGYSQFGDHFMSPLLIEATAGLTPTAAGFGIEGIPLNTARALNTGTGRFRRASVSWIWRRAAAERLSGRVDQTTGERLADTALPKPTVQAILDRATKRIEPLESSAPSFWRDYESKACPYDESQSAKKRQLVSQWASELEGRGLALDVGCNVGTFAEVLAENFERVIAIDNDSVAIDILYQRASSEPWGPRVTPAVVDLAQPTPAIGWMNRERASFLDRLGVVDVSIWLAVLHHLILTSGIPLPEVLNLIARTSRHAIIEHIAPEDASVASMTAGRRWAQVPGFAEFASRLDDRGFVTMQSAETSPTRTLVLVRCPI